MRRTMTMIIILLAAVMITTGCETTKRAEPYRGVGPYEGPSVQNFPYSLSQISTSTPFVSFG